MSNSPNAALYNWRGAASRSVRAGLGAAFPQRCALCACAAGPSCLCVGCEDALGAFAPACPRCALLVPGGQICGRCLAHPPAFDAAVAAGPYAYPLDRLVRRLKYGADLPLATVLGARLARAAERAGAVARVDAIVPMPLAPERQRMRGCNQAREIAKAVSRATGLPLARGLVRMRHGKPQASLAWRDRVRNVRRAFAASRPFDGQRLALVDDVMTSGATAAAAAAALRKAGAVRVEAWVVARTPVG
ncbi:MAG: ComF family protein [Betaproteobacteria bacterium]